MLTIINEYKKLLITVSIAAADKFADELISKRTTMSEKSEIRDAVNSIKRPFFAKQEKMAQKIARAAKKEAKLKDVLRDFAYTENDAYRRFDIPVYDEKNKRWYDAEI